MMQPDFSFITDVPSIAIAVSGGGDSMALAHMLSKTFPDKQFHAITVDHALRDNSAHEATQVGVWLAPLSNVTHTILRWDGDKPQTGKMQAARDARYALIATYCRDNNLPILALAHHGDDQTETFFMRLVRGSGLDGLASMRATKPYDDHLTLWRPLLSHSHDDLLNHCRAHNIDWVEDPTNENPAYTRTRFRAFAKLLGAEGLSVKRLTVTAMRLARAQDALETLAARLHTQSLRNANDDMQLFDLAALKNEPAELGVRVLRRAVTELGQGATYGPRYDKIEALAQTCLHTTDDLTTTLGGCVIQVDARRQTLRICREKYPLR